MNTIEDVPKAGSFSQILCGRSREAENFGRLKLLPCQMSEKI